MLGVAIRIAQRMGIHDESATRRFGVLEAEMRRRLWWSLVLFDDRMSNLAEHNSTILSPAWDCKIPLNVNDSDLREEMKEPPKTQKNATEAMCAVVRCELAEFLRHSPSHLDFTNPALKPIAKELPAGGDPDALLKAIEDEYLRFCDLEIPLHFITIWIARAQVSKNHLTRHYSRYPSPYEQPSDSQRDAALFQAFNMLECDTKILNSPLTMGYRWLLQMHFPFPAYIHVVGELRRRPHCQLAEQAWEVMADNFEARFRHTKVLEGSPFIMFTNVVLQAWEALEETLKESDEPMTPPRMITNIKEKLATIAENNTTNSQTEHASGNIMDTGIGDFPMPMPIGFGGPGVGFGPGGPGYSGTDPGVFSNMTAQAPLGVVDPLAFASMYWGFGERRGW